MLNAYFGRLIPLMRRAGGEVHQIVGDELMVVFAGVPGAPNHALARRASRAIPARSGAGLEGARTGPRSGSG
jgi:class 3 adenylate cyclase